MRMESDYWQQIQAIYEYRREKDRHAREVEREECAVLLGKAEKGLERSGAIIAQATDLVIPILQDIEAKAPQIQGAPLHEVTQTPSHESFHNDISRETKVFLSGSVITLRWGTKFQSTDAEQELVSRYQRSRLPFLMRNVPDEILEYDFWQVSASITRGTVAVSGSLERQSVNIEKFVTNPIGILPGLASALEHPKHRRSFLLRRSRVKFVPSLWYRYQPRCSL